ncbi:ABC transporter ATP-binding protein [Cutibacterium acnes JCM 18916]|nr:ABC transporter ATP-binding protein [Cutibacterium acnes JCM 18916]
MFQSFNLMPTLSAADNITLPLRLSHTKVDKEWFDHITGMLGITERLGHKRRRCLADSSSASPSPAPW